MTRFPRVAAITHVLGRSFIAFPHPEESIELCEAEALNYQEYSKGITCIMRMYQKIVLRVLLRRVVVKQKLTHTLETLDAGQCLLAACCYFGA